jgi:hypothetical protein
VIVWVLIGVGAVTAVVVPVLEEIRHGSEEAQGRMIRLEERRAAMEADPVGG